MMAPSSFTQQDVMWLLLSALGFAALSCCVLAACRSFRGRHSDESSQPLLRAVAHAADDSWEEDGGVVRIGVPARDFVRLSAVPQSPADRRDDLAKRRCVACGEVGRCVALRP